MARNRLLFIIGLAACVVISYHGMLASRIGFFDFSFIYAYIAGICCIVSVGIGIVRRSKFIISASAIALLLIISSGYTTQDIVNYQVNQARAQGKEIVQSIKKYRSENGEYPQHLSVLGVDSTFFLGLFPANFRYKNQDSTFLFNFPASGGGKLEWSEESQELYWYD